MMQGMMPGDNNTSSETAIENPKLVDLSPKFDKTKCYARNESSQYPMTNLFIGDSRLGCKSDADEQLIIHIEFNEFVKVHSIKFTEFNRGMNSDESPTKVHIYVNRNNMGFEDMEDLDPTQTFELTADDLKEGADPLTLKFVKFQRVRGFTLFVEDNNGGDVSALGGLKIFGKNVATTNMNDFKKQG